MSDSEKNMSSGWRDVILIRSINLQTFPSFWRWWCNSTKQNPLLKKKCLNNNQRRIPFSKGFRESWLDISSRESVQLRNIQPKFRAHGAKTKGTFSIRPCGKKPNEARQRGHTRESTGAHRNAKKERGDPIHENTQHIAKCECRLYTLDMAKYVQWNSSNSQ